MTEAEMPWDEFRGDWIKWIEPGQVVEGVVTSMRVSEFKGKRHPELVIDGQPKVAASQTNLHRQLAQDPPAIGERIRIEYLGEGEAKAGQNAPKLFTVNVTHANGSAPAGPAPSDLV
jgi:hypothetical protein